MRRLRTVALACLLAAPVFAQNKADMPWWTSPVVQDLGLSQQQLQHIRQIVRGYRNRLFDARNAAQKAEADLQDMMNDANPSPQAAKPVIERLAASRADVTRLLSSMSIEIRAVLTEQQWRELEKRWAEVQRTKKGNNPEAAP